MNLKQDVIPVTELKRRTKEILERVNRTGDPVLVTQNGHSAVLIVDVGMFQKQQSKLRLLEEIARGERELLEGKRIAHTDVVRKVESWLA